MRNNRCVSCGEIIPEGRQVCPNCESKTYKPLTEKNINSLTKTELYNRLYILEKGLKNGTLIELPCKVGDKVYRLWTHKTGGYIQDYTIVKIEMYAEEVLWFDDSDNQIEITDFGETIFLTKAEAEANLLELQGVTK